MHVAQLSRSDFSRRRDVETFWKSHSQATARRGNVLDRAKRFQNDATWKRFPAKKRQKTFPRYAAFTPRKQAPLRPSKWNVPSCTRWTSAQFFCSDPIRARTHATATRFRPLKKASPCTKLLPEKRRNVETFSWCFRGKTFPRRAVLKTFRTV